MNGLGLANFNALMGIGPNEQKFNMYCIGGITFPWPKYSCDDSGAIMDMFLINPSLPNSQCCIDYLGGEFNNPAGNYTVVIPGPSQVAIDVFDGFATATDVHTVSTPEPTTVGLLLLGIVHCLRALQVICVSPRSQIDSWPHFAEHSVNFSDFDRTCEIIGCFVDA
jgi:hypothetical protein